MTEKCQRNECERKPTHYVELAVPAEGDGPNVPKMRLTFALELCRDHAEACEPSHILALGGEDKIAAELGRMRHMAKPDFERAEVRARRIGDKQWNQSHGRTAR